MGCPGNTFTGRDEVIEAIVTLREQLTADGLDAGPLTPQWQLIPNTGWQCPRPRRSAGSCTTTA
jgi:hypothetical protein